MIRRIFNVTYDFIAWAVTGHDSTGRFPDRAYRGGDSGFGSTVVGE